MAGTDDLWQHVTLTILSVGHVMTTETISMTTEPALFADDLVLHIVAHIESRNSPKRGTTLSFKDCFPLVFSFYPQSLCQMTSAATPDRPAVTGQFWDQAQLASSLAL